MQHEVVQVWALMRSHELGSFGFTNTENCASAFEPERRRYSTLTV